MMEPDTQRLDYGSQLIPPAGYQLDAAIVTTYSLDLNALLAVPVALVLANTLEGDLRGEKLALLEAVSQLKGRLKVFYQAGKLKVPAEFNRLFTLMEPWLSPIEPPLGVNSSFHPKLWLMRFCNESGRTHYRLLVLSRNLTFDRSWDIAVSLEGPVEKQKQKQEQEHQHWTDFINAQLATCTDFTWGKMRSELSKVRWQAPANFRDPRLLWGDNQKGRPVSLPGHCDRLAVVSPFLASSSGTVKGLDLLAETYCPDGEKYLFSRREELDRITHGRLKGWHCYALNERITSGEDQLDGDIRTQNLHAKLIVAERGKTCHWHLGSANATAAALGTTKKNDTPRNIELMLRLTGYSRQVGIDRLRENWLADDNSETGLFVPYQPQDDIPQDDTDEAALKQAVRALEYQLIKAAWQLTATPADEASFNLSLKCSSQLSVPATFSVEAGQLALTNSYQPIQSGQPLQWQPIALTQISALLPVRILNSATSETLSTLLLQVALRMPANIDRSNAILRQMLDSEDKVLAYIDLLLAGEADKETLLQERSQSCQQQAWDVQDSRLIHQPLFERLMNAAAYQPHKLADIDASLQRLDAAGVKLPEQLASLWTHFKSGLNKRKRGGRAHV